MTVFRQRAGGHFLLVPVPAGNQRLFDVGRVLAGVPRFLQGVVLHGRLQMEGGVQAADRGHAGVKEVTGRLHVPGPLARIGGDGSRLRRGRACALCVDDIHVFLYGSCQRVRGIPRRDRRRGRDCKTRRHRGTGQALQRIRPQVHGAAA